MDGTSKADTTRFADGNKGWYVLLLYEGNQGSSLLFLRQSCLRSRRATATSKDVLVFSGLKEDMM